VDGDITTGVSKLMAGQQDTMHSANSAICSDADPPPGLMCCLAQDEHHRRDTDPEKYGCKMEMMFNNSPGVCTKSEIGDVSL
jgi:hypothetical protein